MKNRKFIVLLAVALLVVISATLVACNTGKGSVSYTVSFVVDGEVAKTAELDNFSKVNGYFKPTKEGYTFGGWYLDANFTEKLSSDSQLKDDLTLYAKFTRKSYTVEFVGADDMIIDSQTVFHGDAAIAPEAPAVSGMEFVGWDVDFSSVTANLTVKALYNEIAKFTVTFVSNGETVYAHEFDKGDSTDIYANTALDALVVPAGFRFVKWVTELDGNLPSTLPERNVTYKAKYALADIEYVEILSDEDSYENITYAPDASITYSADLPIYDGITYSYSWYLDGEAMASKSTYTLSGLTVGTYNIKVKVTASCKDMTSVSKEASLTLNVTPANMEVSAVGGTITYDGQAHNITVNSLPGDVVEYKVEGGDWASTLGLVNTGTYNVYYRVSRANYNAFECFEPVTLTITKKEVVATINPVTLTYGDTFPTTFTLSYSGFVNADDASVFDGNVIFYPEINDTKTVGEFTVSGDTSAVSADNYYLSVVDGKIKVQKKVLIVTANDTTTEYGSPVPELTLSYNGFVAGETVENLDTIPSATCNYVAGISATGKYDIIVGGGASANYEFVYRKATLTVTKKTVTITAGNATVTFGEALDLSTISFTESGALASIPVKAGDVSFRTEYEAGKNAGEYSIIPVVIGSYINYVFEYVPGTLTVEKAEASITLNDATVVFGDNLPALSVKSIEGVFGNDKLNYSISCDYVPGVSPVGTMEIGATIGTNVNYNITVVPGTLTITKKAISYNFEAETATSWSNSSWANAGLAAGHVASGTLTFVGSELGTYTYPNGFEWTVTFDIKMDGQSVLDNYDVTFSAKVDLIERNFPFDAEDKTVTYDGNAHTIEVTNVKLDEEANQNYTLEYSLDGETWTTDAPSFLNVGDYKVFYRVTPEDTFYYPDRAEGFFTLHITAKTVTVTVDAKSKTYGETTPLFTGTVDGVVEGETADVTYFLVNNLEGNDAGDYTITAKFVESEPNYVLNVVSAPYTVSKKDATIVVADKTITYSEAFSLASHEYTLDGILDSDSIGVTFTTDYTDGAGAGTYTISPVISHKNYTFAITEGTLTVEKCNTTVVWSMNSSYTYNGEDQFGTVSAYFLNAKGEKIDATITISGHSTVFKTAGDYTLTASHADTNFVLANSTQQVTIQKADYVGITHPAIDGGVYSPHKTLADHALEENFTWADSTINPIVNNTGYGAYYNADPANYNDFVLVVAFGLTKAPVTITGTTQELVYTDSAPYKFNTAALSVKYDESTTVPAVFEGALEYTVSSTYQFTAVLVNDNYEGSALCTLKVKSVDVGGTLYTIEDALNVATSGNVIVKANTAFSSLVGYYNGSQYYTVKSGVTLLLPYKDGDTTGWINGGKAGSTEYNSHPNVKNGDSITPVLYVSLDIPSSVTLNVSGTLTVGAKTGIQDAGTKQNNVTGGYGQINLSGNIVVNSATLNVYGYIKGTGKITATGSTAVTENMYLSGWCGGSISAARFIGTASGRSVLATNFISSGTYTVDDPTMFPFNQYELRAIQTTLELQYGTSLRGIIKIATSEQKVMSIGADAAVNQGYFNIVSSSTNAGSALIRMLSADAKVTKSFGNDRVRITTDGTIADGYADISTNVISKTVKLTSEKVIFPIDGRIDLVINSGTFTQNYQYKLLPGATLTINSGATLTSNHTLITYKNGFTDIATYPYPTNRGDAKIVVAGTLNANKAIGGDVFGVTGGKLVVGASTTVTSVKSLEGTGTMVRDGLNMVFTFSESNSQVRDLTLNGTTKGSAGTTYTYNGSTWA